MKKRKNKKKTLIAAAVVLIAVIAVAAAILVWKGPYHFSLPALFGRETDPVRPSAASVADEPTEESSSAETPPPAPVQARIMAVGDNLMHRSISLSGQQPDGSWNYTRNFQYVAPIITQADLAVLNQECVMGGLKMGIQNFPTLNTGTEVGPFLVEAGFDVILGANNHILDQDIVGIENMMNYWKSNYPQISLLGIHQSQEEADSITVIEKNGIRIALLNYTYDTNIHDALEGRPYLVNFLDKDRMAADLEKARKQADFIVVFPHWGEEYQMEVDESQQELTQFFAEQGVDLIIGSHPHVLESVRWIQREGDNPMLVYYSLGNFQSIQYKTETMLGGLADVTITKDQSGTYISDHSLEVLVTHFQSTNPDLGYFDLVTTYPWEQYTPELAAQHAIQHEDPSFSYEALEKLRQRVMETTE